MRKDVNPVFRITCKNCGSAVGFDIPSQTYRCVHCGTLMDEAEASELGWKALDEENWDAVQREEEVAECTACGARILFKKDEASRTCAFCGGHLVRRALQAREELPELLIPFVITKDEAKERLLGWAKEHEKQKEARRIQANIEKLEGYYLPYRLVRGPAAGNAMRNMSSYVYRFKGFLEGALVNASRQLDNELLEEAEPFDWSAARPFQYAYIGGHRTKLSDLSQAEIQGRVMDEAAKSYEPYVQNALHSQDVFIQLNEGKFMNVPVLLPMYVLRDGTFTAVLNGQTGKIAVPSLEKPKESSLWLVEPTVLTVAAMLIMGYYFNFWLPAMLLAAAIAGLVFFSFYGDGRSFLLRRVFYKSKDSRARREKGELILEEGKGILKNPFPSTPVFYANDGKREAQVEIHFYTIGRILSLFLKMLVLVFLPAILAVLFHGGSTEGLKFVYGAAWYCLAGAMAIMYWVGGIRIDLYNHPILYEILPKGQKKLFGSRKSRRLSMLALFGLDRTENKNQIIGVIIIAVFFLLGSTGAIML